MSLIKVTSEDLSNASNQLIQGSNEIDSRLSSMKNLIDGLVGSDWQGAASAQFNSLYTQWHTSAGQLQQALQGIAQLLGNAATAYAETEQQIQQSMSQG